MSRKRLVNYTNTERHSYNLKLFCTDLTLSYRGQRLANNSLLSLENLTTSNPIYCVSALPACCDTVRADSWFLPGAVSVNVSVADSEPLYQSWSGDRAIQLPRSSMCSTLEKGLYHCDVPDAKNITQTLYIGICPMSSKGKSAANFISVTCIFIVLPVCLDEQYAYYLSCK